MNIEDFSCFCEVRANAKVKIMLIVLCLTSFA